jgi:Holliday junction resolvase RusA-like endonuclease
MTLMTESEMRNAMHAQGFTPDAIERAMRLNFPGAPAGHEAKYAPRPTAALPTFPIRIELPWSALCSDNFREAGSLRMRGGKPYPAKVLTARYKAAKDKARYIAGGVMAGFVALSMPLQLHALVYAPNASLHDICNFAKCCHDALEKIVYVNDAQLHRVVWERVGVDVDRPRAEITVSPL